MPLSSTRDAIGAVSETIRSQLQSCSSTTVTVSRPDVAATDAVASPKLNLFLYQIDIDPYLKNHSLDEGQPPPLWLVLRYLITAYDDDKESDSIQAHHLLGNGLACLHKMNILNSLVAALSDNPEPLKLSFDTSDVELLSKVMQGSDEKYRISSAFQIRPVLIAPDVLPSYAPPVLTVGPPNAEGVIVLPSMGPVLKQISPSNFEGDTILEFSGDAINSNIESVFIGTMELSVIAAFEGAVQVLVPQVPDISAGYHPACVAWRLASGRQQTSNPLFISLQPTLLGVVRGALTANGTDIFGDVTLNGERLGGPDDAIFVAFYRDGFVALNLEVAGTATQNSLIASVSDDNALPPGTYYLILRVNGTQAMLTPPVSWIL